MSLLRTISTNITNTKVLSSLFVRVDLRYGLILVQINNLDKRNSEPIDSSNFNRSLQYYLKAHSQRLFFLSKFEMN